MKVLVIDDKLIHQQSARETLKGHQVEVLTSFDDAMFILQPECDYDRLEQALLEAGWSRPGKETTPEKSEQYWKLRKTLEKHFMGPPGFDAVLTDMMMPMSEKNLRPGVYQPGELVPYGLVIALRAALCGVKYIAMVTDTNHHQGALSAALDHLGEAYYLGSFKPNFTINGAKAMFVHAPFINVTCTYCGGKGCGSCRDGLHPGDKKDWGQVLKDLTTL